MSYSDWDKVVYVGTYFTNGSEGQILDYTGSTGIPAPTSSVGTQGRMFRYNPVGSNVGEIAYLISSTVSSSMFNPIVSSSAYSLSTWVRMDDNGSVYADFTRSVVEQGCGLVIKCVDNPPSNGTHTSNNTQQGYRLMLTTDGATRANRGDGRLSLKLCGKTWSSNNVICSGSYTTGSWYRIRLDLFERQNVPSLKSDELYAYLYNTGSQTWEEVGHLSIDQYNSSYIPWNTTNDRVGIRLGGTPNAYFANIDVLFSYDGFEISQVPWDRNNPG